MKGRHHQDPIQKAQGLALIRTAVVHPVDTVSSWASPIFLQCSILRDPALERAVIFLLSPAVRILTSSMEPGT